MVHAISMLKVKNMKKKFLFLIIFFLLSAIKPAISSASGSGMISSLLEGMIISQIKPTDPKNKKSWEEIGEAFARAVPKFFRGMSKAPDSDIEDMGSITGKWGVGLLKGFFKEDSGSELGTGLGKNFSTMIHAFTNQYASTEMTNVRHELLNQIGNDGRIIVNKLNSGINKLAENLGEKCQNSYDLWAMWPQCSPVLICY